MDRMQGILESAMIQSQQVWIPVIQEPRAFEQWIPKTIADQKFIAHCEPGSKRNLVDAVDTSLASQLILIGPEGDFTTDEIKSALENHFTPVTLGDTRLRSETAAVAAAVLLKLK